MSDDPDQTIGSATGPDPGHRLRATLSAAAALGFTRGERTRRLFVRTHASLIAAAVARSGLRGSELLEYALARVAVEGDPADPA